MAYLPLSTANLPDPVIDPAQDSSPEDYFNTVLYTGTSDDSAKVITGVGFQPDFIWSKGRSGTYAARDHFLRDAVRGANKNLHSNVTDIEATDSGNSFDSDGVTLSADYGQNGLNTNHVLWAWKAGTAVSGTTTGSGTLKSYTGSVNTTSGFAILNYEGNGQSGHEIPHHLDYAPEFVIVKPRDQAENWNVQTQGLRLNLNLTGGGVANYLMGFGASTVTLTDLSYQNGNEYSMLMYAFHSVEGFSKFGSYVGNDSPNGNFIYTGFSPALIVIKYASGTAGGTKNWYVWDNARSPQNVNDNILYWNTTDAEGGDSAFDIDRLSNGFKLRNSEGGVNNAATYIYMAFAENPFKYSNAR